MQVILQKLEKINQAATAKSSILNDHLAQTQRAIAELIRDETEIMNE
jgi:hypothetical protein